MRTRPWHTARAGARLVAGVLLMAACGGDGAAPARAPAEARPPPPVAAPARGDPLPLVPRPRSVKRSAGAFAIDRTTRIAVDDAPAARAVAERLAGWLGLPSTSIDRLAPGRPEPAIGVVLRLTARPTRDPAVDPPSARDDEAHAIDVTSSRAVVRATRPAGLFYGAQTLAQLAGARRIGAEGPAPGEPARWSVPCVAIEDAPRFALRAMHLDVVRHFFAPDVVERWIDLLSFYRFNVFHWHLTDDQGFRFQVKSRPELADVGGRDGSYTRQQVESVVRYARDRFITVVPEIEMPGHARAILAAHPELSCTGNKQVVPRTWGIFDDVLCAGNDATYELIDDVLREVVGAFPSRLVHVGGDEVPPTRWAACAKCRAAMKSTPGGDVPSLQALFTQRITSILARHGRRAVVWDEALSPALAPDAIVVAWQSMDRGRAAAEAGHEVVMAPHDHVYFDTYQSRVKGTPGHEGFVPWERVRAFDPVPPGLAKDAAARVLGAEGTLWTEHVATQEQMDTLAMPRTAALAEALWSGAGGAAEADFVARFGATLPALDASGVKYFIEPPVGLPERKVLLEGDVVTVTARAPRLFPGAAVRWTAEGATPAATLSADGASWTITDATTLSASVVLPGGRSSPVVRSRFVKERPRPPTTLSAPSGGVDLVYVEGDPRRLADVDAARPLARRRAAGVSLTDAAQALGARMRAERFGLRFDAWFDAPADGVYRFVVVADDGVRVEVDGEALIEDDGEHEPRESSGEIALARGHHRLRVSYFQAREGKALELMVAAPGRDPARPDLVVDAKRR